jgi:hypothetical protein
MNTSNRVFDKAIKRRSTTKVNRHEARYYDPGRKVRDQSTTAQLIECKQAVYDELRFQS